jgi:hypothetical protein
MATVKQRVSKNGSAAISRESLPPWRPIRHSRSWDCTSPVNARRRQPIAVWPYNIHRLGSAGIVPGLVPVLQRQSETKLTGPTAPTIAPKERHANASASAVAVYDGRDCIDTIERGPKGDSVAYDDPGKHLGSFRSFKHWWGRSRNEPQRFHLWQGELSAP